MTNALLIRRRGMMKAQQGGLPYNAEIEYIRTTGTQYIDTLLTLTADTTKITCEFQCKINTLGTPSKMYARSYPSSGLQVYTNQNNMYNQGASRNVNMTTIYTVTANSTATNRNITVNGLNSSVNFNRSVSNGDPIYIFGSPDTVECSHADFYYFKLLRNNVLIFDGIPVRVGTVGYMYDRVSGQLFGNDGTGAFTLGPDVP